MALPEVDEAEDFVGLLAFSDVGVGVAEHLAIGVLGEEGEDAGLSSAALGQIVGLHDRVLAEVWHGVEVEIDRLCREQRIACDPVCQAASRLETLLGVMREECSARKLFLGMALRPQNRARPWSATSAMTWLLRSIDQSLRARAARKACSAGIMREPDRAASAARRRRGARDRG